MSELKFCIKVVINKEKTKVLFAEASGHFVDVLLSLLLLPLLTIIEVLEKQYCGCIVQPVIGSLTTLYRSAENLHIDHFHGDYAKKRLINSSTLYEKELYSLRLNHGTQPNSFSSEQSYTGVFSSCASSFIITDDLCMFPIEERSIVETLSTLGIAMEDMDFMETRNVWFGLNEIIGLLKESLICSNPFTSLIFPDRRMVLLAAERHVLLHQSPTLVIPENMILKAILQKSTNKLLFAQKDLTCVYMVRDDLRVSPLEVTSGVSLIKELKISLSDVKEVKLQIGVEEGLSILKAALTSTTALTDGLIKPFLSKQEIDIKPFLKQEME
ncbi:uncharacterized protein LOC125200026 [Salvia hispanica]|uniref:uncharacterized protein LOC125200026 n=1 Tax=Salvia hispanica TaxID=49212 RepID=UPI00200971D4|nr:uncharacterized protein LOC125200026 [Salvia hispanica]